jgi:hypothetical protein
VLLVFVLAMINTRHGHMYYRKPGNQCSRFFLIMNSDRIIKYCPIELKFGTQGLFDMLILDLRSDFAKFQLFLNLSYY